MSLIARERHWNRRHQKEVRDFILAKVVEPFDGPRGRAILRCNKDKRIVVVFASVLRKRHVNVRLRRGKEVRILRGLNAVGMLVALDVCESVFGSRPRLEPYVRRPKYPPRY